MKRLLKIEFRKVLSNRGFWIMIIMFFILFFLVISGLNGFLKTIMSQEVKIKNPALLSFNIYKFPYIWQNITYVAKFFSIFLAVIGIIFICNEFSYRTLRQGVINGLSRKEFLISKVLLILFLSAASTLFIFLTGVILGFLNTSSATITDVFSNANFLGLYFLQTYSYLSIAFFIAFWLKRSGLSIVLLLLYTIVINPILAYKLPGDIGKYIPLTNLHNLIHMPFERYFGGETILATEPISIILAFVYTIVFTGLIFVLLRKRDL